jgi:hypothetical protein
MLTMLMRTSETKLTEKQSARIADLEGDMAELQDRKDEVRGEAGGGAGALN